jgi:carbonic anhydrase/acetyltransferase-like protein (isoleucine patch superfamily)
MIYQIRERKLESCGDEFYVAPTASVIGSIRLGRWASVWFGATLRGDSEWIELGDGSNVQDGSVMHTDLGAPLIVGRDVTIGHMVLLHTCTVGDGCLIANGAVVLDHAVIGSNTIVAAGALVPPKKVVPSGVVIMGSPAKVVREVTDEDVAMIRRGSQHYVRNAQSFRCDLKVTVLAGLLPEPSHGTLVGRELLKP